jgi:hypothetical protein
VTLTSAPSFPPVSNRGRDRADVPAERVRSLILPRTDRAQIVIVTFCFPVADRSSVSDEPSPTSEHSTIRPSLAPLRVPFPTSVLPRACPRARARARVRSALLLRRQSPRSSPTALTAVDAFVEPVGTTMPPISTGHSLLPRFCLPWLPRWRLRGGYGR